MASFGESTVGLPLADTSIVEQLLMPGVFSKSTLRRCPVLA
jgi:hypothetical protein